MFEDGDLVYASIATESRRDEKRARELAGISTEKWDMDGAAR